MRLVLDTNIVVSYALRPTSLVASLVERVLNRHQLLLSTAVVGEMRRTLSKPKFSRVLTHADIDRLVDSFSAAGEFVDRLPIVRACRDPDDDSFLALAIGGKADAIISGDQDLLVLHPFQGIPIFTPSAIETRL